MTDNEIIKALEWCLIGKGQCSECLLTNIPLSKCRISLYIDILDLINRQQAEIEESRNGVKSFKNKYESAINTSKDLQSVIKEKDAEIERLKAEEEKYPFKCVMPFNSMVCSKSIEDYDRLIGDIGAEAIKEFADRLKEKFNALQYTFVTKRKTVPVEFLQEEVTEMLHGCTTVIDSVVKEMVGEDETT